jgi:hypothetical protein
MPSKPLTSAPTPYTSTHYILAVKQGVRDREKGVEKLYAF